MTFRLRALTAGGWQLRRPDGATRTLPDLAAVNREVAPALTAAVENRTPFYAILAFVGVETDEDPTWGNRLIDSVVPRSEFPLPLWAQVVNTGHDGAALVGRIEEFRVEGNAVLATGSFDNDIPETAAVYRVLDNGMNGLSIDMSSPEGSAVECVEFAEDGWCRHARERFPVVAIGGATIVGMPAFADAALALDGYPPIPDDLTPAAPAAEPSAAAEVPEAVEVILASAAEACCESCAAPHPHASVVAASVAAPEAPPAEWFADPVLDGPTPLTVTEDGRVFGHIALFDSCHTSYTDTCVRPPTSESGYAYFRTGTLRAADGTDVPVGQLTVDGRHADDYASARAARAHYDNTTTAWADVAAGEDRFGIWVAGAARPGLSAERMREIRASAPSGDWRKIGDEWEMVAVLNVPVQGFPVPRLVASGGVPVSLVAAAPPPDLSGPVTVAEFLAWADRVAALEGRLGLVASAQAPLLAQAREAALARARGR